MILITRHWHGNILLHYFDSFFFFWSGRYCELWVGNPPSNLATLPHFRRFWLKVSYVFVMRIGVYFAFKVIYSIILVFCVSLLCHYVIVCHSCCSGQI